MSIPTIPRQNILPFQGKGINAASFVSFLSQFGGAAAAYSLRDLNDKQGTTNVVEVRRSGDDAEKTFKAKDVRTIEDWVNGKLETTLPNQVSPSTASFSLRKVNPSYSGDVVRIRRTSDNVEVNVGFDSDDKVSTSSPITNVPEEFLSNDFNTWATAGAVNVTSSSSFTASDLGQGVQLSVPTGTKLKVTGAGTVTGAVVQLFDWISGGNKQTLSGSFSFSTTFTVAGDQQKIYFRASAATSINFTSLTIEVVNDDGGDTTATTLGAFLNEEVTGYSSDFSTTNGWQGSSTLVSANVDANADGAGVPPSDDFLKMVANPRLSIRNNSVVDNFVIGAGGGVFNVTFDYYAPQDISTFKVIVFSSSGNPQFGDNNQIVAGSGSFSATVTLTDAQAQTLSDFRVGSTNDQTGKTLYIKNLQIKRSNHNATVHTWYDQSGNANNATQSSISLQPKIAGAGIIKTQGGKPCLDFDGIDDVMEFSQADVQSGNIRSVFVACSAPTSNNTSVMGTEGEFLIKRDSNRSISTNNFNASRLNSAFSFSGTGNHLVTVIRNFTAPSSSLSLDGDVDATRTDSYGLNSVHQIGGKKSGSNIIEEADFNCLEIIVYASDQTTNRFKIESNINNYYGIYTVSNDGFVETWYDQSGNNNNATQPATDDQPSIVESGNLINGIKFSGDGSTQTDFLKTNLVTTDLGTEFCLGVVGTIESTHSSTARHSVFGNTKQVGAYPNGRVSIAVVPATGSYRFTNENGAETSVINSPAVGANTEAIVLANYDDASVKIRVNGSETTGTITSPNLNDSTTTLDIMRAKFNNSVTRQPNSPEGTVRELFVYTSNQSSTLEAIETNINNHYRTF